MREAWIEVERDEKSSATTRGPNGSCRRRQTHVRTGAGGLEGIMPPDALETLRQVNEYLRPALVRLRPERGAFCQPSVPRTSPTYSASSCGRRNVCSGRPASLRSQLRARKRISRIPPQPGKAEPTSCPTCTAVCWLKGRASKLHEPTWRPQPHGHKPARKRSETLSHCVFKLLIESNVVTGSMSVIACGC